MQIIAHTPEGIFYSKVNNDVTENDAKELEEMLTLLAEGKANYFKLDAEEGSIFLGKELLAKSVFMLRKNTNEE